MIRRLHHDNHSVGIVIDSEDDKEDISFCSTCAANGEMSRLKERLYLDSAGKRLPTPQPDADSWRQCWTCGLIIATREVKKSGTITGIQGIEISQNPFDENKGMILGNDSKNRYQRLKQRKYKHPDKEVQKHIDDGYELTSYFTSMPT